ncbi:GNS1/SUR4 family-domain-containing protein [Pelagophyceae sp. CCMP2097]|nr:GNS1/SUR4 family-domain-containing protein [Pelagophyceae sp. CCMP2097]
MRPSVHDASLLAFRGMEESFHPNDPSTSPFGVSTQSFREHMFIPALTCVLYVGGIAGGMALMQKKKAWDLRRPLAAWNFFLAIFSLAGALRTAPRLIYNLANHPLQRSICHAPANDWGAGACGFWVQLFVLSKFAELLDTAFIVLRKRKVLFLHWFHHLTVLAYCWHAYAVEAPHALFFVAMNFCVHAAMYFYYGLMAVDAKPNWLRPGFITAMQISQMVVGIAVQAAAMRLSGEGCVIDRQNTRAGALMYGAYLALFVKFAYERFVRRTYARGTLMKTMAGVNDEDAPHDLHTFPATRMVLRALGLRKPAAPGGASTNGASPNGENGTAASKKAA